MVALLVVVASMAHTVHSSQHPAPGKPPQEAYHPIYIELEGRKLAAITFVQDLLPWGCRLIPVGRGVIGYPASDDDPVLVWYRQAEAGGEDGRRRDVSLVEYAPGGREVTARWEIAQAVPVAYKQEEREDQGRRFTETQVEFEHQGVRRVIPSCTTK